MPKRRRHRSWIRAVIVALVIVIAGSMAHAPVGAETSTSGGTGSENDSPSPQVEAGVRDSVVRLYLAVFARDADADGLAFWVDLYVRGLGLERMGHEFMTSAEWEATYGDVDDAAFIRLLYANVLDRDPDAEGERYWRERLAAGTPRVTVLLSFSESAEFVSDTGTAAPVPPPPVPYPAIPADSGQGLRIIYDNSAQRVWMIDGYDLIVQSHLVSGKRGVPDPGVYRVYSKSELAWAGHDDITMQWMVRFAHGDDLPIGFHAIPRDGQGRPIQSESQLGTHRSAGCVRQADPDAEALFDWAAIGTPVVVLP